MVRGGDEIHSREFARPKGVFAVQHFAFWLKQADNQVVFFSPRPPSSLRPSACVFLIESARLSDGIQDHFGFMNGAAAVGN